MPEADICPVQAVCLQRPGGAEVAGLGAEAEGLDLSKWIRRLISEALMAPEVTEQFRIFRLREEK